MSSRVEPSVGDVNGGGPAADGDGTGGHAPDSRATDRRARDGVRARKDGAAPIDLPRIERAVREILEAIGEDPERDGLRDTPRRVAKMYADIYSGLHEDPGRHLSLTFEEGHDEMVMVKDIPALQHVRAPPGAMDRAGPRGLHPEQ